MIPDRKPAIQLPFAANSGTPFGLKIILQQAVGNALAIAE
jgi:hypothetical protein